jgi:hypothetical protein
LWWGCWGCALERRRGGGGHGLKKPKPSRWGSVSAVPCQMAVWGDSGRVRGGVENVLEVVGVRVRARARGRGGQGLKKPKPSRWGSVSVVPCQTAVGGDSGRERGGVENVLQVVGVRVRARARGRGPRPKKTETDPLGLGFGCAVSNGGWGR